ncbi:hypothetical protein [Streptomyces chartreusis]
MALAQRLSLFEPLLDDLAIVFCPDASWPAQTSGDPVQDAYRRCEEKRLQIGRACATSHEAVLVHAGRIMRAVVHDHCPSGNRQLIEPLVAVLGHRLVMEAILDYLETGPANEKLGAAMAAYWAFGSLQYSTFEEYQADLQAHLRQGAVGSVVLDSATVAPQGCNAEMRAFRQEFRTRVRDACLRAFLASDDPVDCRYWSFKFTLNLDDYPAALHPEVEAARQIAERHPERYRDRARNG